MTFWSRNFDGNILPQLDMFREFFELGFVYVKTQNFCVLNSYIPAVICIFLVRKIYLILLKGNILKNKRGYRLKANHFSSRSRPMKVISDFLISRN